jgi:hypothetical protein
MASTVPFTPSATATAALTTSQNNVTVGGTGRIMRFVNAGAGLAYVGFYEATGTPPTLAAATSVLIPPGAIEIFAVPSDTTRVATLGDTNGTSLNITRGEGI